MAPDDVDSHNGLVDTDQRDHFRPAPTSLSCQEPPSKRARVDDVSDEDEDMEAGGHPRRPWIDYSPRLDVKTKGKGLNLFEKIGAEQAAKDNPWAPFADEEEWELAHWLMTRGLSQAAIDDYLKLPIVSLRLAPRLLLLTDICVT
ncbi:hypothetical protein PsYK624_124720 [Phanerochaete sordida]|uniref:Uncharacterized protein n=1 Tax=Phanerochaete sordida TaxID=48140 RepID=A0A9P3GJW0_9APHY|nr:hypothetical protein PsYK624_124720 [Phanerochaete sordida]